MSNTAVPEVTQQLIRKKVVAELIGRTTDGVDKLQRQDPAFPKPIKFSSHRQSIAYYSLPEIQAWIAAKLASRGGV